MERLRRSPERGSFGTERYHNIVNDPSASQEEKLNAAGMIDVMVEWQRQADELEEDPSWREDNLEYDLRTSETVAEKAKSDRYAQNLYAALCNNDFVNKDGKEWSCSWRYAGGIVAHIREEGDYIDWYCSGIRNVHYNEDDNQSWDEQGYVAEGVITEEILADLAEMGWALQEENK